MKDGSSSALETLVVGIDGACFRVLDPLFASGTLPTLDAIFDGAPSGPLESQIPPWTASAWPSVYTGSNPGKHGVFGFLDFDGYDWDVVNASHVKARTLWELLDLHDRTSVVVNAPVTYPPPEIDGAVVPGYLAPEDPTCHPEGILDDIKAAIGDYRVYAPLEGDTAASSSDRINEYRELIAMRGGAFRYLTDRFDPAFGFLQFQHTDTILHEAPEDDDAVGRVYGAVDEEIGAVLDACQPDTVIVVSDHGLGPYRRRVRVNEVLRDAGFVRATRGGEGMPTWASIRDDDLAAGRHDGASTRRLAERGMAAAARMGVTAQRVGRALDRFGLRSRIQRHVPDSIIRAGSEQVDFPASAAYVRSRVECGVRINLAGREPAGVVAPDDYETVRNELIDVLSDLETPGGEPVFSEVARREVFFQGPEADRAVDVVTVPNDFDSYVTSWLMGERFADPEPPGWDHKREGVIAVAGAGIDRDAAPTDADLFDVAPTVLATLGVPWDEEMDGRPLPFVDDPGSRSYPSRDSGSDVVVEDTEVEARLTNLGYLG